MENPGLETALGHRRLARFGPRRLWWPPRYPHPQPMASAYSQVDHDGSPTLRMASPHRATKPGWMWCWWCPDLDDLCGVRNHARALLSSPLGRRLDFAQAFLTVAACGLYVIETYANALSTWEIIAELFIAVAFIADYALRFAAAANRCRYVVSLWAVVDLLSIVPVYAWPKLRLTSRLCQLPRCQGNAMLLSNACQKPPSPRWPTQ